MSGIIINKIKNLEIKAWISDSEKMDVIQLYHRDHYCNANCLIHRMNNNCCHDDFNDIKINQLLRDKIYRLIKEEVLN